jgi:hypothetical protein
MHMAEVNRMNRVGKKETKLSEVTKKIKVIGLDEIKTVRGGAYLHTIPDIQRRVQS